MPRKCTIYCQHLEIHFVLKFNKLERNIQNTNTVRIKIFSVKKILRRIPDKTEQKKKKKNLGGADKMFFQKIFEKIRSNNILELNLQIFKYYGILLDDSVDKRRRDSLFDTFRRLLLVSVVAQHSLGTAVELYLSVGNIEKAADCLIFLISHVKNVVKLGTFIIYRRQILRLLSRIEDNYYVQGITPTDSQKLLVQNYMILSRKIAKYVWISFVLTQASLIVNMPPRPNLEIITDPVELKNVRRESSIHMWMPFKAIESPYFEIAVVYECVTMTIYFAFVTTVNITLLGAIIHMTALFALLADTIENGVTSGSGVRKEKLYSTGKRSPSISH
jgi:7tm Odorant receptor.